MYNISENLIIEQVLADMNHLGISPRGGTTLICDSKLHRYTVEGDNPSTKNGVYRIHTDGRPAWYLCDWKRGIEATGHFDSSVLSGSDLEEYRERINDKSYMEQSRIRRETFEREERKNRREATERAKELYEKAMPATPEHEYLRKKRMTDIKFFRIGDEGELLIPLHHAKTKEIMTFQRIYTNGKKYFIKDTVTTPACYEYDPEEPNDRLILICEGVATGQTIYRLTERRFRVVCAMNCHNLLEVTKALKERYPRADIIIGADNDLATYARTGNNPGRSRAEFVVTARYAKGIVIPDFKSNQDGSDWNDYEEINGLEKAQEEFNSQLDAVLSQPDRQETPNEKNLESVNEGLTVTDSYSQTQSDYQPPLTGLDYILTGKMQNDLENFRKNPDLLTGFDNLDTAQGGIYPGFYVLGATPSLGKTTFMVQMSDNMAKSGSFVLYFSLEQSRLELTMKSISRLTAQRDMKTAVSSINIRRGQYMNDAQREAVRQAIQDYQEFAANISIVELGFDVKVSTVADTIQKFMDFTGMHPVVVIDYLQILKADTKRYSTKDTVDDVIRVLKKLQTDNNLVLIAISSFNRTNYNMIVDYESFKETGSIEYTCDVLWGLQPYVLMTNSVFDEDKKGKQKRQAIDEALITIPRKVMLKNLKNRFGRRNYSCGFIYDCRFDLFIPDKEFKIKNEQRAIL